VPKKVAWKTITGVPDWLNEGVACYMAGQTIDRAGIQYEYNRQGHLPTLNDPETNFVDVGGYGFSFTIADWIVRTFGMTKLAQLIERVSYPVLGFTDKTAFQTAWHNFLMLNYINTPPPAITLGTISRSGQNWIIKYSPHGSTDADNNTLTAILSVTGPSINRSISLTGNPGTTLTDSNGFQSDPSYAISGTLTDGIKTVSAMNTGTFRTPRSLGIESYSDIFKTIVYPVPAEKEVILQAEFSGTTDLIIADP